ncbi:hypothetical protein BGZ58_005724 [Dissophora ornata]|nr:hypothetical protein BGZ58_005724 [Dissophora ornata]
MATLPHITIYASEALDHDSGILAVYLIGANLDRSGAYCESYIDSDYYQFRSQVQRSRSPRWSETADIFVKELEYAMLVIIVKEKSLMERDLIIGDFVSNIRALLESTPAERPSFLLLGRADQRETIQLKFEYLPEIELLPMERLDNKCISNESLWGHVHRRGVNMMAHGGHVLGQAGMAEAGAIARGVGAVGHGAMDVTGAVGKGAIKGVKIQP